MEHFSEPPFSSVASVGKSQMDRWEWQDYMKLLKEYVVETTTLEPEKIDAIQIEIAQIKLLLRSKKYLKE